MALINTAMRLKDDGVVARFEMFGEERARLYLRNGKSIVVHMSKDEVPPKICTTWSCVYCDPLEVF